MTKGGRLWRIISGLFMLLMGAGVLIDPYGAVPIFAGILSLTFTLRGLSSLIYYGSTARHMVGGKLALYRGIIYMDAGLFMSAIADEAKIYIILYLAILHGFAGIVDLLRSREAKSEGSPVWKGAAVYGTVEVLLAAAVLIGGYALGSVRAVMYIYGAGLMYTACVRIGTAFRRTAIVYIQ